MMFLPKNKPLKTCSKKDCQDCNVEPEVNCHFSLKQLLHFCCISLPSILVGGAGLYLCSGWLLFLWILIIIAYFGFLEIKVMCSHCPHYAEDGKYLKCWANYSVPKLWKFNPGPMDSSERGLFLGGLCVIWGLPLIVLIFSLQIFLLITFIITTFGFYITLKKCFCSICMNFACPFNCVAENAKEEFLKNNPEIAEAWGKTVTLKEEPKEVKSEKKPAEEKPVKPKTASKKVKKEE